VRARGHLIPDNFDLRIEAGCHLPIIRKIGRQIVAGVDGGRQPLEMIVALSWIGEPGISGDRESPCLG